MKLFYFTVANDKIISNFNESQLEKIKKYCVNDIRNYTYIDIQGNTCTHLFYSIALENIIKEAAQETIKIDLIMNHKKIINELLKENDIILKYNKKDNEIKIKKLKIEKL